jgi:hypothetical protein
MILHPNESKRFYGMTMMEIPMNMMMGSRSPLLTSPGFENCGVLSNVVDVCVSSENCPVLRFFLLDLFGEI